MGHQRSDDDILIEEGYLSSCFIIPLYYLGSYKKKSSLYEYAFSLKIGECLIVGIAGNIISIRGEGGTIILQQILTPLVKSKTQIRVVLFLSFIALSFIIGDGVLTPAISILSAVEGLVLVPAFANISISHLLVIAVIITIKMGYMEIVDIEEMLQSHGIAIGENVIFYGIEDIVTNNPLWKVFDFIKTNSPSFVHFYNFSSKKLLGVITSVEL